MPLTSRPASWPSVRCRSGSATGSELTPRKPWRAPPRAATSRAACQASAAGMTTVVPRIVHRGDDAERAAAAVDQRAAGQRAVRRQADADRRGRSPTTRPVRSGPPTTDTGARAENSPPLQVRPTASAMWPARRLGGGGRRRGAESGHADDGQAGGGVAAEHRAFEGLAVAAAHRDDAVVDGDARRQRPGRCRRPRRPPAGGAPAPARSRRRRCRRRRRVARKGRSGHRSCPQRSDRVAAARQPNG